MKKIIAITMALLCMLAFSACTLIEKAEIESSVVSEADDKEKSDNDTNDEAEQVAEEYKVDNEDKEEDTDVDSSDSENSDESSEEKTEDKSNDDSVVSEEQESDVSIEEIGQEIFEKSCETQWKYLLSCPYETDYDDMNGYAVRVVDVSSLSEIEAEYCEVFAQASNELYEKYFEADGAVYCYDGGRGANISYLDTELILASYDDEKAEFTAVSHYADPQTGEAEEDEENPFVIVYKDGQWKTSEFTLPY